MTDLAQMLAAVETELRDKQAAIRAADIQLGALRAADKELRAQLADLQQKLAEARKDWKTAEAAQKFLSDCEDILLRKPEKP